MIFDLNANMKKKQTPELKTDIQSSNNIQISPFVKSLSTDIKIPIDLDYKKVYGEYLQKKYR